MKRHIWTVLFYLGSMIGLLAVCVHTKVQARRFGLTIPSRQVLRFRAAIDGYCGR
jgi:hypothetical protein